MSILLYINQALLKRGGGRGRPDFTIIFRGGGEGKKHLSHTKRRRRGVGVGESILHCKKTKKTRAENRTARSEEVGGHTAQDQKQI